MLGSSAKGYVLELARPDDQNRPYVYTDEENSLSDSPPEPLNCMEEEQLSMEKSPAQSNIKLTFEQVIAL